MPEPTGLPSLTPLPSGVSLADFIKEKQAQGKVVRTTSRSAAITHQRCPRRRFFGYHLEGRGITRQKLYAPLATGGYTHVGLANLLQGSSPQDAIGIATDQYMADCSARGFELEKTEDQDLVIREQVGLVEAFVWLAYYRVIPRLLEQYEVLEVEREEWFVLYEDQKLVIVMEARCDALLRERAMVIDPVVQAAAQARVDEAAKVIQQRPVDRAAMGLIEGDLYVLSWKTLASWDKRQRKEAKTDMQGLSEAYAVELRVNEPVMGAQMVHLLKGKRKEYPDDSGKWIQSSPFVHCWMNGSGPTPEFAWCYAWADLTEVNDWGRPVNHRLGKGWRHCFIPDVMPMAEWVQMLNENRVQPDIGKDALESQFILPMPEPRSPQQKQRWLRGIEKQEVEIATATELLATVPNEQTDEVIDSLFPMFNHSCNYPTQCSFWEICWGGENVENPMSLYQIRDAHHPGEQMLTGDE